MATPNHGRLTPEDVCRLVAPLGGVPHPCYGCGVMLDSIAYWLCYACGRFVCQNCWHEGGHGSLNDSRCNFPFAEDQAEEWKGAV
jgi:hypothetical protein